MRSFFFLLRFYINNREREKSNNALKIFNFLKTLFTLQHLVFFSWQTLSLLSKMFTEGGKKKMLYLCSIGTTFTSATGDKEVFNNYTSAVVKCGNYSRPRTLDMFPDLSSPLFYSPHWHRHKGLQTDLLINFLPFQPSSSAQTLHYV